MTALVKKIKGLLRPLKLRAIDAAKYQKFRKYIVFPHGPKTYIMGAPQYTNLGDSAITLAQRTFLEKAGAQKNTIKEITREEYQEYHALIMRHIKHEDKITCIGGGNMGDAWLDEELLRQQVMKDFPKHDIIVFPQTIYFTPTKQGDQVKQESIQIYDRPGCTLTAREKTSYSIMRELYPHASILLTPDIVLSMQAKDFGAVPQPRNGILLVLRNDEEAVLTQTDRAELQRTAERSGEPVRKTDMYANEQVTRENRAVLVRAKLEEFASARLVVTDRLHGMVFAALTGTPCVVLGNYNHKVSGTYQWIHALPYVRYVNTVQEACREMADLLQAQPGDYPAALLADKYTPLMDAVQKQQ